MFISGIVTRGDMATSKTGSFWLTETVTLAAAAASGARAEGTIDLGAYVDVGDQQALAIEQVDYIWQVSSDYGSDPSGMVAGNATLGAQLSDLNPGVAYVRADDNNLVSSAALSISVGTAALNPSNISSHSSDFYPDTFGKLDQARIVVNDQLYLTIGVDGAAVGGSGVYCTCRIKCRIVKLSTKDWMAIAIQSTASDN
jgi:hypothetical protein